MDGSGQNGRGKVRDKEIPPTILHSIHHFHPFIHQDVNQAATKCQTLVSDHRGNKQSPYPGGNYILLGETDDKQQRNT